jgi:hypothetical protein
MQPLANACVAVRECSRQSGGSPVTSQMDQESASEDFASARIGATSTHTPES